MKDWYYSMRRDRAAQDLAQWLNYVIILLSVGLGILKGREKK